MHFLALYMVIIEDIGCRSFLCYNTYFLSNTVWQFLDNTLCHFLIIDNYLTVAVTIHRHWLASLLAAYNAQPFPLHSVIASCGPGKIPSSLLHFPTFNFVFSIFYCSLFPFSYSLHLFSCFFIHSHSTRIVPLRFQARCYRR